MGLAVFAMLLGLTGGVAAQSASTSAVANDLPRPFATGDIFLAVSGVVYWYDSNGNFVAQLNPGLETPIQAIAADPSGKVWAVNGQPDEHGRLARIDQTGAAQVFSTFHPDLGLYPYRPWSLAFDAAGNVYVGDWDTIGSVSRFSGDGAFLGNVIARESEYIDLAPDQCTMFVQSANSTQDQTQRWDACTGGFVDTFHAPNLDAGEQLHGVRILPDGSVLIRNIDLVRVDRFGQHMQTYSFPECTLGPAESLSPDGSSFYARCSGRGVYEVDVATGALIRSIDLPSGPLTVMGGFRAAATVVPRTDTTPPAITVSAPVEGATYELGSTVATNLSCTDAGDSGLASCNGPATLNTSSIGTRSVTFRASDWAGNAVATTIRYHVGSSDVTPPTIEIRTPAEGANYALGQAVTVDFSCADAESGVLTCAGLRADGAPLDTSTAGPKSFTVNARDLAGNASVATVSYTVGPKLNVGDATVGEGGVATLVVSLTDPVTSPVSVRYATQNGTGRAGIDFARASGRLTFGPGETSKTISISTIADALYELDETALVTLSSPAGASLGDAQGVVTITNDDAPPTLTITDVERLEGAAGTTGTLLFTVTQSAVSGLRTQVTYGTADGTAVSTSDYRPRVGTATINAGVTTATISVTVRGDALVEPDEWFRLLLGTATNAAVADPEGVGTIRNDD